MKREFGSGFLNVSLSLMCWALIIVVAWSIIAGGGPKNLAGKTEGPVIDQGNITVPALMTSRRNGTIRIDVTLSADQVQQWADGERWILSFGEGVE